MYELEYIRYNTYVLISMKNMYEVRCIKFIQNRPLIRLIHVKIIEKKYKKVIFPLEPKPYLNTDVNKPAGKQSQKITESTQTRWKRK